MLPFRHIWTVAAPGSYDYPRLDYSMLLLSVAPLVSITHPNRLNYCDIKREDIANIGYVEAFWLAG